MWNVLIDRKGVNRIQTELLLRKAQSGDTGCAGHSDCSVLSTNSELLSLAYSRRAAGAGCNTGNLFESGALAGFLWWISGGIPSLSVQNRKKHLHRSEPYYEADGGIAGKLAGRTAYQESGFAAAEEKANLRVLTAQLGAGTAGTSIAAVRTTA